MVVKHLNYFWKKCLIFIISIRKRWTMSTNIAGHRRRPWVCEQQFSFCLGCCVRCVFIITISNSFLLQLKTVQGGNKNWFKTLTITRNLAGSWTTCSKQVYYYFGKYDNCLRSHFAACSVLFWEKRKKFHIQVVPLHSWNSTICCGELLLIVFKQTLFSPL